jgi:hypothetical protein
MIMSEVSQEFEIFKTEERKVIQSFTIKVKTLPTNRYDAAAYAELRVHVSSFSGPRRHKYTYNNDRENDNRTGK